MSDYRNRPKSAEGRDNRGRFAAGNPGKKPGSRNRVNGALHKIFGKGGEAVAKATLQAAEGGDMAAARLVLERLFPARRPGDHYLEIALPRQPAEALDAIIEAVGAGELLPAEGERLAALVKARHELASWQEIEERLALLEARQ